MNVLIKVGEWEREVTIKRGWYNERGWYRIVERCEVDGLRNRRDLKSEGGGREGLKSGERENEFIRRA